MAQTMTQLKRNLTGYRLLNQYNLELLMGKDLEDKQISGNLGVINSEENRIVYNKDKIEESGLELTKVTEEYIKEMDSLIITVDYVSEEGLGQAQYLAENNENTGKDTHYRLILIEEE